MQHEHKSKSKMLMQLIGKPQIAVSVVVAGLLIGCGGGGGSTPAATTSYTVSVVDDNIVGSTLTAAGCTSSTDNKNGTYILSGCSAQPTLITAQGGFIDTNGNGSEDANESTQDSPLVLRTSQTTGTAFNVTPLTTLAYGLSTAEITALKAKLGGIDLFGKEDASKELRQTVNALLAGATESGLDVKTFGAVLARQINSSTGTGITGIKEAIATIKANPSLLDPTTFGLVKITGFLSDGRVNAVRTGSNVMTAMVAEKVPDGKIRISGFIYDDVIANAVVIAKIGDTVLGTTTADAYGRYTFTIDRTSIPAGETLQFIATLDNTGTGEDIKLTSLISTDKLLASMVNSKTNASKMGDLIVSNVTTAKAIIAEKLNPNVLTDGSILDSTMLTVESGYADTVVKVAGEIKYIIDGAGTTGSATDTLAYAQSLVTSTGGTTGITTDHSSLVTGDVVLNGQLSTEITVIAPTAVSGIAASKAMFQELRTQALSLVDYKNSGTPGFIDTKALAVQEATRDVAGPDVVAIGYFVSAMQLVDKNSGTFALNVPVNVIEATQVTSGANYGDMYGNQYTVKILGSIDYYMQPYELQRLLWMNDTPYSMTVTRTGDHSYSYTFTNANDTTKTYSGTFGLNNLAISMTGTLPVTKSWTYVPTGGSSAVHNTINVNVTGTVGAVSSTTGQFNYAGTIKTYAENGSLDSTFTVTSAKYNLIKNGTALTYEPLSFDGVFAMKTYTLTGKVTASNYIDINDTLGRLKHFPKNVMFDGKAEDSTDGSYISGLVTGAMVNTGSIIDNSLYDVSFTGKLNVPNRPLTTVILTMKNIDADKADVTLSYTYDKTKIDVTGVIANLGTVNGINKYTAQLKNQAGVTIDIKGDATGKKVIGIVSKDGISIGTIDMLSSVPRVIYYDGTFETLI
ncbi:MAG: hypothetical protein NTY39_02125 [Campylobacterales bacterium]|nr:hypothetical protein [Campylobacterales bacterium]